MQHVIVDSEKGRYFGWPANDGIWSWDDEIVVGYTISKYTERGETHSVDTEVPSISVLARSKDGGTTWRRETPEGYGFSGQGSRGGTDTVALQNEIDFCHPDLAIRCGGYRPNPLTPYRGDSLLVSYDRCRSWEGPYALPDFGFSERLTSRTDYQVLGRRDCLLFLSVRDSGVRAGDNAGSRDRAFCARTTDGGRTFSFVAWMLPESKDARSVFPSTVRISDDTFVSAMRRRFDAEQNGGLIKRCWIDASVSEDGGSTWKYLSRVADTDRPHEFRNGSPPALARLQGGRLCCAYGYRGTDRTGIRARVSEDSGRLWSEEIVLRDDARTWDIGYPCMVVRPDGRLLTIYYYTTNENPEQHIAATIWHPDGGRDGLA